MRVLFIGNSHTYFNDMPELFARRCFELTGEKPYVTMLAYPGRSFEWHYKEFTSCRFQLMYGGYDFCVLQQQGHPFPGEETTFEYGKKLTAMCRDNGVTPVIYMPWTESDNLDNIGRVSACYRSLAAETGALLAPVGEMFDRIARTRPGINLYYTDGRHASPEGDYLISLAIAAAVTGSTDFSNVSDTAINFDLPDGSKIVSPGQGDVTLPPETAEILRETVRDGMR
ncbi:MAG: hypothetical protein K6D94_06460 [Clostridiales bacterium]|nr:hypothetical protein [Clostridiales bacterium]